MNSLICCISPYRKTGAFFMEKTILGTQNEWYPFQKYPTNILQNVMEYSQILSKGALDSDVQAFVKKNKEFLDTGMGLNRLFTENGMASNSTIQRCVQSVLFYCLVVQTMICWAAMLNISVFCNKDWKWSVHIIYGYHNYPTRERDRWGGVWMGGWREWGWLEGGGSKTIHCRYVYHWKLRYFLTEIIFTSMQSRHKSTHQYSNFNSGSFKLYLKLCHSWVIAYHRNQWMWFLTYAVIGVLLCD